MLDPKANNSYQLFIDGFKMPPHVSSLWLNKSIEVQKRWHLHDFLVNFSHVCQSPCHASPHLFFVEFFRPCHVWILSQFFYLRNLWHHKEVQNAFGFYISEISCEQQGYKSMANLKSFPGNFLTLATITTNVGWNHKVLEIDLDLMTMALRLEYLVYIKIRLKNPTSHEMEIKDSLAGIIAIRYLGQILWVFSRQVFGWMMTS